MLLCRSVVADRPAWRCARSTGSGRCEVGGDRRPPARAASVRADHRRRALAAGEQESWKSSSCATSANPPQRAAIIPARRCRRRSNDYLRDLSDHKNDKPPDDRIGVISFHRPALIDAMPNTTLALDARPIREVGTAPTSRRRSSLAWRRSARTRCTGCCSFGRQRDDRRPGRRRRRRGGRSTCRSTSMPLDYDVKNEVLVERFIAPTMEARERAVHDRSHPAHHQCNAGDGQADGAAQWPADGPGPAHGGRSGERGVVTLQPGPNVERIACRRSAGADRDPPVSRDV